MDSWYVQEWTLAQHIHNDGNVRLPTYSTIELLSVIVLNSISMAVMAPQHHDCNRAWQVVIHHLARSRDKELFVVFVSQDWILERR